jgi:hypothetical protein
MGISPYFAANPITLPGLTVAVRHFEPYHRCGPERARARSDLSLERRTLRTFCELDMKLQTYNPSRHSGAMRSIEL